MRVTQSREPYTKVGADASGLFQEAKVSIIRLALVTPNIRLKICRRDNTRGYAIKMKAGYSGCGP